MASTGWILGYAVPTRTPFDGTWRDTRLGGHPIWPPGSSPSPSRCPVCNSRQLLVLQAYAPHASHAERILLLFGCNSAHCSQSPNSWLALRVMKRESEKTEGVALGHTQDFTIDDKNSGGSDINWDSDSAADSEHSISASASLDESGMEQLLSLYNLRISENSEKRSVEVSSTVPFSTIAKEKACEMLEIHSEVEPKQESFSAESLQHGGTEAEPSQTYLAPHFIEVFEEPANDKALEREDERIRELLDAYKKEEKDLEKEGKAEVEWASEIDTEDSEERRAADTFRERIAREPSQILRYKLGGSPIWPNHRWPDVSNEFCPECGGSVVFEYQILGTALFYLDVEKAVPESQVYAGMNFAALAVYTCARDCEDSELEENNSEYITALQIVKICPDEW